MLTDPPPPWAATPAARAVKALSISTGVLVALLATGAFALSFDALNRLAVENGVTPGLTWVWPLVLDGAIVVFSLSALRAGIHREPVRYPMTLVVIATSASVVFNVAHAPGGLLAHTMAAVPPAFLFLSFELLMRQLRSGVERTSHLESLGELAEQVDRMRAEAGNLSAQISRLSGQRDDLRRGVKADRSANVRELLDKANVAKADKIRERRAKVAELAAADVAVAEIAEAVGVSAKTVKRDIAELGVAA